MVKHSYIIQKSPSIRGAVRKKDIMTKQHLINLIPDTALRIKVQEWSIDKTYDEVVVELRHTYQPSNRKGTTAFLSGTRKPGKRIGSYYTNTKEVTRV